MPGRYICGYCNEWAFMGYPESHSNRCRLWGGHTEERCPRCQRWYRPEKGQTSELCRPCTTQLVTTK